jgi:hypothetical protein
MITKKRGASVIGTTGTTWANTANALGGDVDTNPATYATWTNAASGGAGSIEIGGFAFATDIPTDATLTNISVLIRHLESNTSRIASVTFQPYDGATPIGAAQAATKATAARDDVGIFTPTLAQLRSANLKVRVNITRAAVTQSAIFSIDHVQIDVDWIPAHIPGRPQVWNGSAWVEKPMKAWSGSAWEEKPVKVWNGSSWVPV